MRRKIYDELIKWKKNSHGESAVLIDGARRVGKSYIAKEFAKNNYKSYILIDFSKMTDEVKDLFTNYVDNLNYLFSYLSNYFHTKLYERDSLIIFDEVQFCPKARSAIKHLVADGRYDYIETGSLISIKRNVKDILIPSEETTLKMYPMDFEEFLWAMGNDMIMDFIKECFKNKRPMTMAMHRKVMDYFKEYLIVGGMPQAVSKYVETHDFEQVDEVKRRILTLYRNDIKKYADDYIKVTEIYDEIPSQLQKHEKRFILSKLGNNARYREYYDSFYWLSDAEIVNMAFNTSDPNIGLNLNKDTSSFKCYLSDTGLLLSMAFDENGLVSNDVYNKILFDKLSFNGGMILENIVAQMFVANGKKLYFYSRDDRNNSKNTMEVDFILVKQNITSRHNIIPIEVKSGKNYTHLSLDKFKSKYKDYTDTPIVIHMDDLKEEDNILYIPIYMAMLL